MHFSPSVYFLPGYYKMALRLIILILLMGFGSPSHAQHFSPPDEVVFSGDSYKLSYKKELTDGRAIFEYTKNNEPIENWSSLITFNYSKPLISTPLEWTEAQRRSLDREKPKPHYSLYTKGSNGYSKIIYEPDARNAFYESNVHKSFHVSVCGGLVVYQFARKYQPSKDQTTEGRFSKLKQIADESSQFAAEMEKSDWLPDCS